MRTLICFLAFGLLTLTPIMSQVKIGDNPQNINPSSVLELESSSHVLVITRIGTNEMNAITPLRGAVVYNTDEQCIFYFDGSQWVNLCADQNTTNVSFELVDDELVLTDSDGNTVAVPLEGVGEQSFTSEPIVNFRETIVITQTGNTFNFEVGEITGENIADSTIQGVDFAPESITQDKIAPNSIGTSELQDNAVTDDDIDFFSADAVTLNDFTNDAGFITGAQLISPDANNAIIDSNGAFYNDAQLLADIDNNDQRLTDHLASDNDLSDENERLTNAEVVGNEIILTESGFETRIDLSSFNNTGSDSQNLSLNGNRVEIDNGNGVDLAPILVADNISVVPNGNITSNEVQSALEELQTDIDNLNAGGGNTDNQNLSTNNTPGNITIDNGNTITLNVEDGDSSQLNEIQDADEVLVTISPTNYNETANHVEGHLEGIDIRIGELTVAGGSDGVISNVALAGNNLNFTGANGGFNGSVDFTPILGGANTDEQDLSLAGNFLNITDGTGVDLTPILGGVNTDEQDLSLAGNFLNITNGTGVDLTPILGGVNTDEQELNLVGDVLGIDNGNTVDLSTIDNQSAGEVPFTTYVTLLGPSTQLAIQQLKDELDIATIAGGGENPTNELQDIQLTGTVINLTIPATPGNQIDLDPIFVTEAELTAFSVNDADFDPSNELQDLNLNVNSLELSGDATPVDLTPYLDNTDAQIAAAVPVTAAPTNYTAATPDVEAHLVAIDTELGNIVPNPTDELQDLNLNVNSLELSGDATPVDLTPYLDNTDAQIAAAVPVTAAPTNYTAATPDVEAHLVAIDTELGNIVPNPTDELQDLNLNVNSLELSGDATPVDLTPYLDNTDAQIAAAVPVTAAPTNYTAATPDVEAHLVGIDAAITGITNTNLASNDLTLDADRTHNLSSNDLYFTNGNIAIGAIPATPQSQLDVNGQIQTRSGFAANIGSAGQPSYGFSTETNLGMYRAGVSQLGFSVNGTQTILIDSNNDVGIGNAFDNTNINAKLHVDGDIRANGNLFTNGVQVVPDYVFQKYFQNFSSIKDDYEFMSLSQLESFLKKNNHLPGVTSAAKAKKDGYWNLSQSNLQNLEKIEELFLHTIEQEKKIEALEAENTNLTEELETLKADMELIKAMLLKDQEND